VTAHPTAEWTGQQLREAFPFDQPPRYMLRDRDAIFGDDFREQVRDMGICEVLSAPRSPWQRAYVERVIGSIRRECLDHVIVFHENALRRTLNSYFDYYHRSRTHLSLRKDSPEPRAIQPLEVGSVVALPQSVDCTTATNDGLPEKPESTRLRAASPWGSEISVRTVLPYASGPRRISFARLKPGRKLLGLCGSPRGMASEVGCTEFSLGTGS
jgi:Integrase core domain